MKQVVQQLAQPITSGRSEKREAVKKRPVETEPCQQQPEPQMLPALDLTIIYMGFLRPNT